MELQFHGNVWLLLGTEISNQKSFPWMGWWRFVCLLLPPGGTDCRFTPFPWNLTNLIIFIYLLWGFFFGVVVILSPFIPPLFSFSLLSFELLLWVYFILKSSRQDEAAFQLWSQQCWRTGITVRALHKAVLFTDTGILVLPAVWWCWIVFSVDSL